MEVPSQLRPRPTRALECVQKRYCAVRCMFRVVSRFQIKTYRPSAHGLLGFREIGLRQGKRKNSPAPKSQTRSEEDCSVPHESFSRVVEIDVYISSKFAGAGCRQRSGVRFSAPVEHRSVRRKTSSNRLPLRVAKTRWIAVTPSGHGSCAGKHWRQVCGVPATRRSRS